MSARTGGVVVVVMMALVVRVLPVRRVVRMIWSGIRTSCLVAALTVMRTVVVRAPRARVTLKVVRVLVVAGMM